MDLYSLRSKRLGFRSWREQDLPLAIGLWGDPEVTRLIDARPKLSDEDVKQLLEKQIVTEGEYGIQYWPLFLMEEGAHVGCRGIPPYHPPPRFYHPGVPIRS